MQNARVLNQENMISHELYHNAHKGTMVNIENSGEMMQNALSHQDLLCFVFLCPIMTEKVLIGM